MFRNLFSLELDTLLKNLDLIKKEKIYKYYKDKKNNSIDTKAKKLFSKLALSYVSPNNFNIQPEIELYIKALKKIDKESYKHLIEYDNYYTSYSIKYTSSDFTGVNSSQEYIENLSYIYNAKVEEWNDLFYECFRSNYYELKREYKVIRSYIIERYSSFEEIAIGDDLSMEDLYEIQIDDFVTITFFINNKYNYYYIKAIADVIIAFSGDSSSNFNTVILLDDCFIFVLTKTLIDNVQEEFYCLLSYLNIIKGREKENE